MALALAFACSSGPATSTVHVRQPPTPLYVEMLADFNSAAFGTPDGVVNHPIPGSPGTYELVLIVSGAEGATSLSVEAGPVDDCGGTWGAAVKHDDGSYGIYTVAAAAGGLDVRPPLQKAVTHGVLANLHASALGQHYTPTGYLAMSEHLWRYPGFKASRERFIAQARESDPGPGPWKLLRGLTSLRAGGNGNANYFGSSAPRATVAAARNRLHYWVIPSAPDQGMEWTVDLLGKTGYLDSYAGVATDSPAMRVEVVIDGVTKVDRQLFGLERIVVPFAGARSGTIRYTFAAGDLPGTHTYRLGTTTWWELPSDTPTWVLSDGVKVVYVGDSWGSFYGGIGPAALRERVASRGGELVNVSEDGKTTEWALTSFDELVLAHRPDVAIIELFTNDRNQFGAEFVTRWRANMLELVARCQAAGIRPVVVLPSPTASSCQSGEHAEMAASIAEGAAQ